MLPAEGLAGSAVHRHRERLMGNQFSFTVVHPNAEEAARALHAAVAEVRRIEALLTTFNEESQTAAINRYAGIAPVKVDQEVFDLIARAQKISALTQGAFDLTYGSIDKKLWNFDTTLTALPDRETVRAAVRLINYRNLMLDEAQGTVFLKAEGMRIGFGGIGKGYAADRAAALLKERGIISGVVNASGDLLAWGRQPNGLPWTIGIADPLHQHRAFSALQISGLAVATSGDYEKFVLIGGKRYSHTIDPRTGLPVSGIKSVTMICPSAELADALATPVMVMGVKAGLYLVNQLRGVGCIIVDEKDRLHTSNQVKIKND
jgi:thiamine biosynthesis lipoprotein